MTAERVLMAGMAPETRQFLVERVLQPNGYALQTAETGPAAMDLIRQSPPHLILAQNTSGLALANCLRQEGLDIPLILVIDEWQPELMREALRAGVADFLLQPLEPPGWATAIEDVLARARLRREPAQLQTILNDLRDCVLAVDADERLLLLNPPARAVLQVITAGAIGRPLAEVIENAEMRALLRGESEWAEFKLEDGRVFNAHSSAIADGGRVVVMQDITRLKELDRIKSDFVNTVSHDLRSPLTAILGYVELIERVGPVTDQQAEFVDRIIFSVKSITALITDLLDLGRIEAGFDAQKEATHLAAIIQIAVEAAQSQADMKSQVLKSQVTPGLPRVLANPPRLRQMLSNLIGNAIKYTPVGGTIRVSARSDSGAIIVTVADTGVGIPPSDLPYVFNRFYRASNTRDRYEGTGLGLSIVKSIVENHGGRIWVDSRLEEGTTFTVILPAYPEAAPNRPPAS